MKKLTFVLLLLVSLSAFSQKDSSVRKKDTVIVALYQKDTTIKNLTIMYLGKNNTVKYDKNGYRTIKGFMNQSGQFVQVVSYKTYVENKELKEQDIISVTENKK